MITQTLHLEKHKTTATISPDFGCNVVSWVVGELEVLYCPPDFGADASTFYRGGIPILFPTAGRTWDRSGQTPVYEQYRITGLPGTYTMPIHGIGQKGAWTLESRIDGSESVSVEYHFSPLPEVRQIHYPFDVEFRMYIELRPDSLVLEGRFKNKGSVPAPVAFGFHPYFRQYSEVVTLLIPCRTEAELHQTLWIPSGRTRAFSGLIPIRQGEVKNHLFRDRFDNCATLIDPSAKYKVHLIVDQNIDDFVIHTSADRPFVCLEPWTKGLGAYETLVNPTWVAEGTLPVLAPGSSGSVQVVLRYDSRWDAEEGRR